MSVPRRFHVLSLALVLSLFTLGSPVASGASVPELPAPSEVVGSAHQFTCLACVAGGVAITVGGVGTVLIAAATPGSAIAVLTCAVSCGRTLDLF